MDNQKILSCHNDDNKNSGRDIKPHTSGFKPSLIGHVRNKGLQLSLLKSLMTTAELHQLDFKLECSV